MATSEAMKRAIQKYEQEKVDRVSLRLPKGMRAEIQEHAAKHSESLNGFVVRSIIETMKRDDKKES